MFYCPNCPSDYAQLTDDGCCRNDECFGEPLLMGPRPGSGGGGHAEPAGTVEGLCILVCDVSASMDEAAFTNNPAPKLKLVVGAMQRAIAELQHMAKADTAYIAIVAFGRNAGIVKDPSGKPFFKSVSSIIAEFGERAVDLPGYLYPYFKEDKGKFGRGETDITGALDHAREIVDCMMRRDLSPLGVNASAQLMEHTDIITQDGQQLSVPNIRVMIYSDGAHGSRVHPQLVNAFADLSPSPVMTAFIGDDEGGPLVKKGIDQMRSLANICPEHGQRGFFLINEPERHAVLRNLFRMASGASGFCEQCLNRDVQAFETVRG